MYILYLYLKNSVCEAGKWACTTDKCSGQCTVTGMGHFVTFDNSAYDFKAECEYTLVEVILFYFLYTIILIFENKFSNS